MNASYKPSQTYFSLKEPLQNDPPSVPSYTPTNTILQDSPAPPHAPPPHVATSLITFLVTTCRSTRKTKGTLTSQKFQDEIYAPHGAQYFISTLPVFTKSDTDSSLE